jgi:hypothetical protein
MSSNIDTGIIKDFQDHFDIIQKVIYGTRENINDSEVSTSESVHVYQYARTTWYNKVPRIIPSEGDLSEKKYNLTNGKHDLLAYTTFRQLLPIIRVKKEFEQKIQVRWCEDPAINIISDAKLSYGSDKIGNLNSKSIRAKLKLFKGNDEQKFIDNQIGNIPELQQWNIYLPSVTVKFEFPWFYSADDTLGLPLYYSCNDKHFVHSYSLNNKLVNLLRMRILKDDDTYEIIPVDLKYLHVEERIETLKTPEIMGIYIKLLPDEVDSYKCWTRENKYGDFYIEDIVECTSDNPSVYGKKLSVEMNENAIIHTMVWLAENRTAKELGNLSNYTTNILDKNLGYDPIEWSTLHIGSYDYFKELHADYTGVLLLREFKGKPVEPGYHVWSFCRNHNSINAKVGVNMSELTAKLTVTLKDRNPSLRTLDPVTGNVIEEKSTEKPEFDLYVYLFVTKKLSFFPDPIVADKWFLKFDSTLFRENTELNG